MAKPKMVPPMEGTLGRYPTGKSWKIGWKQGAGGWELAM